MADGKDILGMTAKERKRLHVLRSVLEGTVSRKEGADLLEISERQMGRLVGRVRRDGDAGVVHRGRGKPSNRKTPPEVRRQVLEAYRSVYAGFGLTLATEKLEEGLKVSISRETLRQWLKSEGEAYPTRKRRKGRRWRERRAHRGEMVQMDGSHHAWFEERGERCVLMAVIDDATGEVFARFFPYEGTWPALEVVREYLERYGVPMAVYLDRHGAYQSKAAPTVEEEVAGTRPMSQFERAMAELSVRVIHARSPQGKGRVERLFGTLQDRLVKEMRLGGIASLEDGNRFLETFLPFYNGKFRVEPARSSDLHRPVPAGEALDRIFCRKERRVVRKDRTIAYEGQRYDIPALLPGSPVSVEESGSGSLRFFDRRGERLPVKELPKTKTPEKTESPFKAPSRKGHPPSAEHPWKKAFLPQKKARNKDSSVGERSS
ncbi:MAG: ISNCY family transposase [Nitrospirae bacterium]|jgi:transposase|nr:ISNCY family transposase [Nitrospirota bacterium]